MNEQLSNLVQVNQELRQDLENLGKLYETVKTENARLAAELAEAKRSNESLVSDVRNHHEVAEQLRAELAALRAEARYVPVSDGERIEIDSAGDSMGIARPSAVHVRGNSRISIEMTSLSMAGASRYLHSGKMPTGHAVCRLVPGQDTQQGGHEAAFAA